jgi:RNA polymerase sigma factor (sigma-70 family)
MNDALVPPDHGDESADESPDPTEGEGAARADELAPDADRPPTVYEHMLVRHAGDVVGRCAAWTAKQFPTIVHEHGVMTVADLQSIGMIALYRAARAFREEYNRDFAIYAKHIVRFAMLNAIDDLLFEDRVKRAGIQAENIFCGFYTDNTYNVMKHDAAEARRRYRAFANGELVAAFVAMVQEAQQRLDMAEVAERREYERAAVTLRAALARLTKPDQEMLALMYRDLMHLKKASETLGIPYGTARARHSRALKLLHDVLVEQGITRAPKPLVVPDVGDGLTARAPPPENDIGPPPTASKRPRDLE